MLILNTINAHVSRPNSAHPPSSVTLLAVTTSASSTPKLDSTILIITIIDRHANRRGKSTLPLCSRCRYRGIRRSLPARHSSLTVSQGLTLRLALGLSLRLARRKHVVVTIEGIFDLVDFIFDA